MAGSSTLGLGVRTQGEGWPEVTDVVYSFH